MPCKNNLQEEVNIPDFPDISRFSQNQRTRSASLAHSKGANALLVAGPGDKIGKRPRSRLGFLTPFPRRPSRRLSTRHISRRRLPFSGPLLATRGEGEMISKKILKSVSGIQISSGNYGSAPGSSNMLRRPASFPGRLPSKDGSERLNPPWSLSHFPILSFGSIKELSVRPLLRSRKIKNNFSHNLHI